MIATLVGALLLMAPTPRERIRFDEDWRFLRMPTLEGAARLGPFEWEWKLATVATLDLPELPAEVDAGDWIPTRVGINVLTPRQYGWFRTDLGNDPDGKDKVLAFDSTDEDAAVYLNGKHIGTHIGFGTAFEMPVRSAWRDGGPNKLAVLIKNVAQSGGINGGVNLIRVESEYTPPEVAPDFDDKAWRTVHLPHDYVVEGTFDPDGDDSHGSLPKPIGLYRKTFTPPESMRGKSVWIEFDGIYRNSDVYLNGEKIGHQDSGYAGFRVELSKHLDLGQPNVLAVRTDPRKNEGWWYEGGGIYRHVWLNVAHPLHIAPDGVFARATVEGFKANVRVTTTLANSSGKPQAVVVRTRILDPKGREIGVTESSPREIENTLDVESIFDVNHPKLWDLDAPNLYRVETTVLVAGKPVDVETAQFGIRTIRWDKDLGFFLNDRPLKLKGSCNHQDFAGVGVAIPDRIHEWRIKKLKEMGSNAFRTAHNPVARELLDACDRLGMLVLSETRHLGDATASKSAPGTRADGLSDLKYQIRHDRNHPSVIAWSLFNEEPMEGTDEGAALFRKMRAVVDSLDGTRLCTGAMNHGFDRGVIDTAHLIGINYNIGQYDAVRARRPNTPIFGSETGSALSTRGIYQTDPAKGFLSAYDTNPASFGNAAEVAWKAIATRPG